MKFLSANLYQNKPRPVLINLSIASFIALSTGTKVILPDYSFVIIESLDEVQNAIIDQASDRYPVIKPKKATP